MLYGRSSIRLCAAAFAAACLWTLCGAPLTLNEWQAVPMNLRRILVQLPQRMRQVFVHWYGDGLLPSAQAETRTVNLPLRIWDAEQNKLMTLQLEEYVSGAVSAEMPAAYSPAALQAQAVAARTRAVWACRSLGGNGCASCRDADLCTNPACCQGYAGLDEQRRMWGGEYAACSERVRSATRCTAGQILTYDGLPIQMLYHAVSGGWTEDASAVFAQPLPYLVSVESPGEEHHSAYKSEASFTKKEAASLLCKAFPGCGVSAEGLSSQLRLLSSTSSGRVETVLVGSSTVTGRQFREALGLKSTYIRWTTRQDEIVFTTLGYGHGVGMSQAGAQTMAAQGKDHTAILAHYYPGTALTLLPHLE